MLFYFAIAVCLFVDWSWCACLNESLAVEGDDKTEKDSAFAKAAGNVSAEVDTNLDEQHGLTTDRMVELVDEERLCKGRLDFKVKRGSSVLATIIGRTTEDSEEECARKCYSLPLCTSANFLIDCECEVLSFLVDESLNQRPLMNTHKNSSFIHDIRCSTDPESDQRDNETARQIIQWVFVPPFEQSYNQPGSYPLYYYPQANLPQSSTYQQNQHQAIYDDGHQQHSPDNVEEIPDKVIDYIAPSSNCGISSVPPILTKLSLDNQHSNHYRIIGGFEARPYSWPWQVALTLVNKQICGGVLVSSEHVVTAAHCVDHKHLPGLYKVIVGLHNIHSFKRYVVGVARIWRHHSHGRPKLTSNDIAVLKLKQAVNFSWKVNSICLARTRVQPSTQCIVSGWGKTNGNDGARLQQTVVPIISNSVCNDRKHYNGAIDDTMICAGYEDGGKDACQGDSGGPLVCPAEDGRWVLHGLVSWGYGCAAPYKPGVYTRVSKFSNWIMKIVAHDGQMAMHDDLPQPL